MEDFIMSELYENISTAINCFGKINSDLHTVFNNTERGLIDYCNDLTQIVKQEKSMKNQRYGYLDYKGLLEGEDGWYRLNSYIIHKNIVKGICFYISIDKKDLEYEDYERYKKEFVEPLCVDPDTPFVAIYGVYEPINCEKAIPTDWVEEVTRLDDCWKNFDRKMIKFDRTINIDLELKESDFETDDDPYEMDEWFKRATIKMMPILKIDSAEKIGEILDDIFDMKLK